MQLTGVNAPTTITSQQKQKTEGIGKDTMDQQDFMNLLIEQLKNQDPLNPTDNAEFMSQTTAFSQLNEMQTMNTTMNTMLEMMRSQMNTASSLFSAAGFIGKQIEFSTNTVTIGDGAVSNISFYLADEPAAGKTQINVYNSDGELAAIVRPDSTQVKKGSNTIPWDGVGVGGAEVPKGTYSFEVVAYGSDGSKLTVDTFSKAIVKGVKEVNGVIYFDVGSGVVSSDYVYSVTNPEDTSGGGKDDGGSAGEVKRLPMA